MPQFIWFLITMAVALCGGFLFMKLKVPAGPLVGALLFTGVLSVLTGHMFMYTGLKNVTKTVAGLFIGMSVTRKTVRKLATLVRPTVILVVVIICLCMGMGIILNYTSGLDVVTSLFCVAPGGIQDMTLMTLDLGGDAAVVAVIQVLRLLSVYFISMPIVKVLSTRAGLRQEEAASSDAPADSGETDGETKKKRILFTSAVALAGGTAGYILAKLADFSTLVLVVSMIVAAAVNLSTGKLYMPKAVRRFTQMMSGALIGVTVTDDSLQNLRLVMLPSLFIVLGFVVINVIIALIISRSCGIDIATAMLSSSAGGATEAALVAPDFGADPAIVTVLQITRMVCTIAFYPILVKLIIPLL